VTDIVGQDDPVFANIERLARPVKLIGKLGHKKLVPGAASAVQHHNRIVDLTGDVAVRLPKRGVVNFQRG
jgi:hypothetical protein